VGTRTDVTARAGVLLDRSPLLCVIDPVQGQDRHLAVPFSVSLQKLFRLGFPLKLKAILDFVLRCCQNRWIRKFEGAMADD
jgi:hypothetical protein